MVSGVFKEGLYGTLFRRNKEAAFSNFRLWESVGFVVAYAYSTHLCARMKLYVMAVVLVTGVLGYVMVEYLHLRLLRKRARKEALATALNSPYTNMGVPEDKAAEAMANAVGSAVLCEEEQEWENDDLDRDLIITRL
ncbi:hypothetical protein J437_LFUL016430 [Ladona fulva]|uniref:Uncharacterized protein n=1 Tax=Ladona fulva TaxID=123851 RepID=A0A8K0KKE4_LADFU|nr:hypothetical protein J437_LFUL016430 [Ladona fulva]